MQKWTINEKEIFAEDINKSDFFGNFRLVNEDGDWKLIITSGVKGLETKANIEEACMSDVKYAVCYSYKLGSKERYLFFKCQDEKTICYNFFRQEDDENVEKIFNILLENGFKEETIDLKELNAKQGLLSKYKTYRKFVR